jgi:hypothetical protein
MRGVRVTRLVLILVHEQQLVVDGKRMSFWSKNISLSFGPTTVRVRDEFYAVFHEESKSALLIGCK